MTEPSPRFWEIFFEVFEDLPRQGPGSRACLIRALQSCSELPASPAVLDLGSGTGASTLQLAELTGGSIVAVDNHAPSIERLRAIAEERGLSDRVRAVVGDIGRPEHTPESYDLVWSEGALYNIGIDKALGLYREVLRHGGYFAFTEAVWRTDTPSSEVEESFADYPGMGSVHDVLETIEQSGLALVSHFTLPDQAWWDDFYSPMLRRIEALRDQHAGDAEALAVLDQIAQEPEMHRRHGDEYAYEFFVLRR